MSCPFYPYADLQYLGSLATFPPLIYQLKERLAAHMFILQLVLSQLRNSII